MSRRQAAWDQARRAIEQLCAVEHTGPIHGDLCVLYAELEKLSQRVDRWQADPGADGEAALLLLKAERRHG